MVNTADIVADGTLDVATVPIDTLIKKKHLSKAFFVNVIL